MISNDYYRYTTNIAFPIDDWRIDGKIIKAVVQLDDSETPDFILEKNDFYAIKGFFTSTDVANKEINIDNLEFEITFVRSDLKQYYVCKLNVCETIDCTFVAGGEFVVVCDGVEDVQVIVEDGQTNKTINEDNSKDKSSTPTTTEPVEYEYHPFSLFDNWVAFPNMTNMFNDLNKRFESLKSNGSKFCEVSYTLDNDGNGTYRRIDNNGVVEKHFKNVNGKMKEVEHKCNCSNEVCKCSKTNNTELKDLV